MKLKLRSLAAPLFIGLLLQANLSAGQKRVVAIGDIHGAYDGFTQILQQAGVIDRRLKWIAKDTILVQTGDILDRGDRDFEVIGLLMDLQKQAKKHGSEVRALYGNHEVMNLIHDLRYVSEGSYAAFAGSKSEKNRREGFEDYVKYLQKQADRYGEAEPVITEEVERIWMEAHPPGFFERLEALKEGRYADWLADRDVVTRVDDTIFLHGGLHPELSQVELDELNKRFRQELENFEKVRRFLVDQDVFLPFFTLTEMERAAGAETDYLESRFVDDPEGWEKFASEDVLAQYLNIFLESVNWLIRHPDGPIWFRGYATWDESTDLAKLVTVLQAYHAQHIVVGHTTLPEEGIKARFGGRVFLIDTGMLTEYYQGSPSLLEINGGSFTAIYLDRKVPLLQRSQGSHRGR